MIHLTPARSWTTPHAPRVSQQGQGQEQARVPERANRSHTKLRGPSKCAHAQLKSWKILHKLRYSPSKAGHLYKAIAVLQNHRAAQAA